jgi:hypothetical protein
MNARILGLLLGSAAASLAAPGVETTFQPNALSGQPAPELTNNIRFSNFEYVSLADDGRLVFTATLNGPGVTSTNNLALWGGLPGNLIPLLRTRDTAPDDSGKMIGRLEKPNVDNHNAVGVRD